MREERDKTRLIMKVLIAIVVVLGLVVVYLLVAQPAYNNIVANSQTQGANYAIGSILQTVQANGYVSIPVSQNQSVNLISDALIVQSVQKNGYVAIPVGANQTLYLVPYNPNQTPAAASNTTK